jgi:hypothetical protein
VSLNSNTRALWVGLAEVRQQFIVLLLPSLKRHFMQSDDPSQNRRAMSNYQRKLFPGLQRYRSLIFPAACVRNRPADPLS